MACPTDAQLRQETELGDAPQHQHVDTKVMSIKELLAALKSGNLSHDDVDVMIRHIKYHALCAAAGVDKVNCFHISCILWF